MRPGLLLFWLPLAFITGLAGCKDDKQETGDTTDTATGEDADNDGYPVSEDCNDNDPDVHPDATEIWYDGFDQNCDGADDFDQDGDGTRGGPDAADCDDTDPLIAPGAEERCNGIDDNCDGATDEAGASGASLYYNDSDRDGVGVGEPVGEACAPPPGFAAETGDCNDGSSDIAPGKPERCDGLDNDCNDKVDDEPVDGRPYFRDFDRDGFGDADNSLQACSLPIGFVSDSTDCDDHDVQSYPDAVEVCDLKDNNCDGSTDEGAPEDRIYFLDEDGDGYGVEDEVTAACGVPVGFAEPSGDCDDAAPAINPEAVEVCNDIDDNCNGDIDGDAEGAVRYHPDLDGDSFGDEATSRASCTPIDGWIEDGSDCDDASAAANPAAVETCNGIDDNCDGAPDDATATDASSWYLDRDRDNHGTEEAIIHACARPAGYAPVADDCDDTNNGVLPGAAEICNDADDDCDLEVDEDATDAPTWFEDADGDSFGAPGESVTQCDRPGSWVINDNDCDDTDPAVNPSTVEVRDLADQDCDGLADEDFIRMGDIVVSEIGRQPYTGGSGAVFNPQAQWFEVYNTSSSAINLSNWYIEEELGDSFFVSPDANVIVPANGYVVFCYSDDFFSRPSDCDYTWGDTSWGTGFYDTTYYFDRDEDLVALYLNGVLMDEVAWTASWPATARYSMRLDSDALSPTANNNASNWCLADRATVYSTLAGGPDYGTPGAANGSCP